MQLAEERSTEVGIRSEEAPAVQLLAAYADFASGLCATRFVAGLKKNFAGLVTILPRFLRFEELSHAARLDHRTKEAAHADMVIIAAHEGAELSPPVKKWLKTWEKENHNPDGALVALLITASHSCHWRTPVQRELGQLAKRTGRTFLCKAIECVLPATALPMEAAR
jgi:hypothetical protein